MGKLSVWPFVINSITVRRKKTSKKVGETTKEKDNETWIFRVSPGNENFAGEEKVLIRFKGTHAWPGQARFQNLLKDKTFKDGELVIDEIPDSLKTLSSENAWDSNRPFGTSCLCFASIPLNPEDPTQEFVVWDPDSNTAILDKNGQKLVRTQEMVSITAIWVPDPESGEGTWVSEFGGSLEEGLRTEMSTQISRNRYKPLGAKKTLDLDAIAAAREAAKADENPDE